MDIRAVAFDVNGTLVKILADDDEERIFRAAATSSPTRASACTATSFVRSISKS